MEIVTSECLKEESERVLRDSEHRQEAAKKAQKRVQELFTWEKTAEKVHGLAKRGNRK